eukprot:jgi/Galph1/5149/GphlegSOOS_G3765.1
MTLSKVLQISWQTGTKFALMPLGIFIEEFEKRWKVSPAATLAVLSIWFGAFILCTAIFTSILLYKTGDSGQKTKVENKPIETTEKTQKVAQSRNVATLRRRIPKTS